jgi:hypothetical protein
MLQYPSDLAKRDRAEFHSAKASSARRDKLKHVPRRKPLVHHYNLDRHFLHLQSQTEFLHRCVMVALFTRTILSTTSANPGISFVSRWTASWNHSASSVYTISG